jgi:uncharacterized membrane protein YhaH (DUF805 family)
MDFAHLFFSFDGRIRRMHFWIGVIVLWVVQWAVWSVTIGGAMGAAVMAGNPGAAFSGVGLIGVVVFVAMVWPSVALQAKRWHDRNKTGWMVLINFIPLVGWLWTLIECGFVDGTPGPNTYGPSPKGLGSTTIVAT